MIFIGPSLLKKKTMPFWIRQIYTWILIEEYDVCDFAVYTVEKQPNNYAIRPKNGAAGVDKRKSWWYIGLTYHCSLREFVERMGDS